MSDAPKALFAAAKEEEPQMVEANGARVAVFRMPGTLTDKDRFAKEAMLQAYFLDADVRVLLICDGMELVGVV